MYANAGGVTVSYFEWVKNLTHIRFGRMQRREVENQNLSIIKAVEKMTGKEFPDDLKASVMQGPTELSLVRSGLDDTMRTGYKAMSNRFHSDKRIKSLRMASMVIAIERIAESYVSLGIWLGSEFLNNNLWRFFFDKILTIKYINFVGMVTL